LVSSRELLHTLHHAITSPKTALFSFSVDNDSNRMRSFDMQFLPWTPTPCPWCSPQFQAALASGCECANCAQPLQCCHKSQPQAEHRGWKYTGPQSVGNESLCLFVRHQLQITYNLTRKIAGIMRWNLTTRVTASKAHQIQNF
jgi:hypothetical protein